jgi:hypothetical protein
MTEYYRRCAGADGGPEDHACLDGGDAVLSADCHDVRSRHLMVPVQEECREVLAVGEAQHRVHRPCGMFAVGDGGFGKA